MGRSIKKMMALVLLAGFSLFSCNKSDEAGKITISLNPKASALVKVEEYPSCKNYRDYYYELAHNTNSTEIKLEKSLSGNVFWFSSLDFSYDQFAKYDIIALYLYVDFNDARIGGEQRCDLADEAGAFYDGSVFADAKADATTGTWQSTRSCKIICKTGLSPTNVSKGSEFTVNGMLNVQMVVQKKQSDEPPTTVYQTEAVTVKIKIL